MTRRLRWLVAGPHLGPGLVLVAAPYERLVALPQAEPLRAFSPHAVTAIGAAQLAGVVGVFAPVRALRVAAAVGLAGMQVGAALTHLRNGGVRTVPLNVGLSFAALRLARAEAQGWARP